MLTELKKYILNRWLTQSVGFLLCTPFASPAQINPCGELQNHYGPYDYRINRNQLPVVENRHFTPQIEALIPGTSTSSVEGDIGYTLRAFPNHPRALAAIVRLAERKKSHHPKGLQYSVDCYFERAMRFRADDSVVRMMYAQWLGKTARKEIGLRQLAVIEPHENPITLNNLGLVYAELGEYEKALELAHQAQARGYTRSTLPQILQRAGHWREATPSVTPGQPPNGSTSPPSCASCPAKP